MAILSKEQQNEVILVGVKLVGSVLIAIAVAQTRKRLAKR